MFSGKYSYQSRISKRVKNEPILITGVGRRIGFRLASTFMERGYPVIGTYRTQRASLDQLRATGVELYKCDFNDDAQVVEFAQKVSSGHDRLRAIIHNASDWLPDVCGLEPCEIIKRMMKVHVTAPYQINQILGPLLEASEEEYADIIHVGDYVSSRGSKKHIAYAASKAAQDNLTYSFSAKFGPKVKVNSLAPALVMFNESDDQTYRHKTLQKSVMGKEGGFDEFQHAVDYLLNSKYVTGRVLPMDGGRHLR